MKHTCSISDSKALNIFKKIGNFLETDEAHQQVLEIVSEMRLKEVSKDINILLNRTGAIPVAFS